MGWEEGDMYAEGRHIKVCGYVWTFVYGEAYVLELELELELELMKCRRGANTRHLTEGCWL